jgi:hypothetical protein
MRYQKTFRYRIANGVAVPALETDYGCVDGAVCLTFYLGLLAKVDTSLAVLEHWRLVCVSLSLIRLHFGVLRLVHLVLRVSSLYCSKMVAWRAASAPGGTRYLRAHSQHGELGGLNFSAGCVYYDASYP